MADTAHTATESTSHSRRTLLAGAIGGLGALAVSAIGRPAPARAGVDGDVVLGALNTEASTTTIENAMGSTVLATYSTGGIGLLGYSDTQPGVNGTSGTGYGVYGISSSSVGVYGSGGGVNKPAAAGKSTQNGTGVLGYSTDDAGAPLPTAKPKTGVFGYAAQDTSARGVWGESPAGIGVYGRTTSGFAGYFQGKVFTSSFHEMSEVATPAAPGANRARLFVRDNGAGKTQLCVRFPTGSVKLLAQET